MSDWISLTCPFCKARLQIKAAYAHLRGRCPECGTRIEPVEPRPLPAAATAAESDEPLGLLPADEDWPEPARVEPRNEPAHYGFSAPAETWAEPPPPPRSAAPARMEGYALSDGAGPAPTPAAPAEPAEESYPIFPGEKAGPVTSAVPPGSEEKLMRDEAPRLPKHPLGEGVFSFPWRFRNLRVLFFLTLDFTVLAFLAGAVFLLIELGNLGLAIAVIVLAALGVASAWTALYVTNIFLTLVEATAAGNDEIAWPQAVGIFDGLENLFYLLWIAGWASLPLGGLWAVGRDVDLTSIWWWAFSLVPLVFLFPVLCMCSLAASSRWFFLEARVLGGLLQRPKRWATFAFLSLLAWLPAVVLGWLVVGRRQVGFAPLQGLMTAVGILVYGRLIGRLAWLLTGGPVGKTGRRRKKRANLGPKLPVGPPPSL